MKMGNYMQKAYDKIKVTDPPCTFNLKKEKLNILALYHDGQIMDTSYDNFFLVI